MDDPLPFILQVPREPGKFFETPAGICRVVTMQFFQERALPPLRHGLNVDHTVKTLQRLEGKPSSSNPITQHGRWRGFAKDPGDAPRPEDTAFNNLRNVVTAIASASGLTGEDALPFLHFQNNTRCVTEFAYRGSNTYPDAFLHHGTHPSWRNIAVCGEHQKFSDKEQISDVSLPVLYPLCED